jgi:uncharacterized protein YaiI (UPF0178 family)
MTAVKENKVLHIFVDADACPVKEEVYQVARRYGLRVTLVSNIQMRTPKEDWIELIVVGDDRLDAADDWIVENVGTDDIVISGDIPLADRCLKEGALVLGPTGRPFTEENIGDALATRNLLTQLRETGAVTGGPSPFARKDRSRFLHSLDEMIQSVRRRRRIER